MSYITKPSPIAALLAADGYKLDHRRAYGPGVTRILINWTNRSGKLLPGATHAVHFGLQAFVQSYLVEAWAPFFEAGELEVANEYHATVARYLGPDAADAIGTDHIRALHRLGYLPLVVKSLPEGSLVPFGVPSVLIENTHPDFFWLPNYIETALSASIWHPSTVATIAVMYRDLMEAWAEKTGGDLAAVDFQAHDFSFRGQASIDAAASAGAGHLLSFKGTDTIPSLDWIDRYYPGENGIVGASVPATEHSVMCLRGQAGELETFANLLDLYPTGIVSAVADGFDFWGVLTDVLPKLKHNILARDGKLVIRPDSGDPVDIICGTLSGLSVSDGAEGSPEELGAVELLGREFGYTVNEKGYKVLNEHIGLIYGDSITLARAEAIFRRLALKGWASTNVVLGVGSFTYQYVTRDTLGSAVKATWAEVDGAGVDIQKDPKTGSGKKSAKGRLAVYRDTYQTDELTLVQQALPEDELLSEIQPIWADGEFRYRVSFDEVRAKLAADRHRR